MAGLHVGVLGMGIGGMAVATMLARQGHRVVLYDRMSCPGPVGSGFVLQPTGLEVLSRMGISPDVLARGAPIRRMLGLVQPSGRTVLDVGYGNGRHGLAIQRRALFDILHASCERSGVEFSLGTEIIGIEPGPSPRPVLANGKTKGRYDLVVDAMGCRSPTSDRSRQIGYGALWSTVPWSNLHGFDSATLEQRYRSASQMAGVLPVGTAADGMPAMATIFWSVRHGSDRATWKDDAAELWPELTPLLADAEPTLATYRHHTRRPIPARGIVRMGDAWHATSPQLGQGANMALLDAIALDAAMRTTDDLDDAMRLYVRMRRLHVGFYQALSFVLTPFYQSDGRLLPAMRDHVVAPLLRRRGLIHMAISRMVSGEMLSPMTMIDSMSRNPDPPST